MDELTYERARILLEAELGDELVALDQEEGQCFGFNEVATSVWRLLDRPRSTSELEQALLDQYEVAPDRCAIELRLLLDELVSQGLIVARKSRGSL